MPTVSASPKSPVVASVSNEEEEEEGRGGGGLSGWTDGWMDGTGGGETI